jgi:hypothetical protein
MKSNLKIEWAGKEYTILASEAFEVADLVEDVITISEIPELAAKPKLTTIAKVYGIMLRFAGAEVTNEEIRLAILSQMKSGQAEKAIADQAITALLEILFDGAPVDDVEDEPPKKVSALSKPRSKSRS